MPMGMERCLAISSWERFLKKYRYKICFSLSPRSSRVSRTILVSAMPTLLLLRADSDSTSREMFSSLALRL